ncbi:MFS transporter [Brachybacterium vulturis]|nr:MFS transporter [Brachybacterium vulturis]
MTLRSSPGSRSLGWFAATSFSEALGDQMARSLAPIIVVSMFGAGTATIGLLHSLGLGMFLLLSIPLGHLGDRLSRPITMKTTSTVLRMVVLALALLAWALDRLEGSAGIMILLGLMAVIGIADVAFTTGRGIAVPRLVPLDQIRSAMGTVHTTAQIGTVLAPLALTALLAVAVPPLAWVAVILAYLMSVLSQGRYRGIDIPAGDSSGQRRGRRVPLKDGISHLLSEPTLRRVTASSALYNAAVMAANTLLPVIALTELGLSPAAFAAIGGAGAVAGVIGAASASRITARHGLRRVRIGAALAAGSGVLLVLLLTVRDGLLPGPAVLWLGAFSAVSGVCTSVSAVAGADLIARFTPGEKLGAVAGAQRTATMGIMPVSALLIGLLGTLLGTTLATSVWLGLTLAAAVPCFRLPTR